MKRNETKSSLYTHENNSTASTINTVNTNGMSQVSTVGFNTLKKQNTHASQASEASSIAGKTKLAKLFTRNKSMGGLGLQTQDLSLESFGQNSDDDDDDDSITIVSMEPKKTTSGIFKFGKKDRSKSLRRIGSSRPDLSIQTAGHHTLKVPKKILTSGLMEDASVTTSHRKNSVSSPSSTFHNLFHRSHSLSMKDLATFGEKDEVAQQALTSSSAKTTLTLSSNNSNSRIKDPAYAQIYNFTNPDYNLEEVDPLTEHNSFHDISKKYMMPTDQYLQGKLSKNQLLELGLGITSDFERASLKSPFDFSKKNTVFYNNLINIIRPILLPSQQKKLSNGYQYPNLGLSLEDVISFIKENYLQSFILSQPNELMFADRLPSKASKSKPKSKGNIFSPSAKPLSSFPADSRDDFKIRESTQDLLTFFSKCIFIFHKDYSSMLRKSKKSSLSLNSIDNQLPLVSSNLKEWNRIMGEWHYFNERIRFFLVGMFYPLQRRYHELLMQKNDSLLGILVEIEIENLLLLAFRDVIIVPFLIQRTQGYLHLESMASPVTTSSVSMQKLYSLSSDISKLDETKTVLASLLENEATALTKNDGKLARELLNCFGVIMSHSTTEVSTDGDHRTKNNIFAEAFHWLSSLY